MAPRYEEHPTPPVFRKNGLTRPHLVAEQIPPANIRQGISELAEDDPLSIALELAGFREVRNREPIHIRVVQHHPNSPDTHVDVVFTPPSAPSGPQN